MTGFDVEAYRMGLLESEAQKLAEQDECHWTEAALHALRKAPVATDPEFLFDLLSQMRLARVFICTTQSMDADQYEAFQAALERLVSTWERSV